MTLGDDTIAPGDLRPNVAILIGGSLAIAIVSALSLPAPAALASIVLGVLMVAGADVDARTFLLPDVVTLGAVVCGIAAAAALTQGMESSFEPWFAAGDAARAPRAWPRWRCALDLRAIRSARIGLGDVKLAAAAGAWLPRRRAAVLWRCGKWRAGGGAGRASARR